RVAFEWFTGGDDIDGALRLVIACQWFAILGMRYELLQWAERAVTLDGAGEHELWPAAAGITAALRGWTGDAAGGETLATQAIGVEESHGYPARIEPAMALQMAYW